MVVSANTITSEREKVVDFAGPYFEATRISIRLNDEPGRDPQDLNDPTCARSTTPRPRRTSSTSTTRPTSACVLYESFSQCVEALAEGDVDAVSTDDVILAGFAAESDDKGVLKLMGEQFLTHVRRRHDPQRLQPPVPTTRPYLKPIGARSSPTSRTASPYPRARLKPLADNAAPSRYVDDGSSKASLNRNVADSGYDIPDPPTPGGVDTGACRGPRGDRRRSRVGTLRHPAGRDHRLPRGPVPVGRVRRRRRDPDAFSQPLCDVVVVLEGFVDLWIDADAPEATDHADADRARYPRRTRQRFRTRRDPDRQGGGPMAVAAGPVPRVRVPSGPVGPVRAPANPQARLAGSTPWAWPDPVHTVDKLMTSPTYPRPPTIGVRQPPGDRRHRARASPPSRAAPGQPGHHPTSSAQRILAAELLGFAPVAEAAERPTASSAPPPARRSSRSWTPRPTTSWWSSVQRLRRVINSRDFIVSSDDVACRCMSSSAEPAEGVRGADQRLGKYALLSDLASSFWPAQPGDHDLLGDPSTPSSADAPAGLRLSPGTVRRRLHPGLLGSNS